MKINELIWFILTKNPEYCQDLQFLLNTISGLKFILEKYPQIIEKINENELQILKNTFFETVI